MWAAVHSGLSLGIDRGCTRREKHAHGLRTQPWNTSTKLEGASGCHVQSCPPSQLKQSACAPYAWKQQPHCVPSSPCCRAIISVACFPAATGMLSRFMRLSAESVSQSGCILAMHARSNSTDPACNSSVAFSESQAMASVATSHVRTERIAAANPADLRLCFPCCWQSPFPPFHLLLALDLLGPTHGRLSDHALLLPVNVTGADFDQ